MKTPEVTLGTKWLFAWIFITLIIIDLLPGCLDFTFEGTLFWADFSVRYENGTRLAKYAYHLGLHAAAPLLLFYILKRVVWVDGSGFERFVVTVFFLWSLKECWDVIYVNNQTTTQLYELISIGLLIIIGYIASYKPYKKWPKGTDTEKMKS